MVLDYSPTRNYSIDFYQFHMINCTGTHSDLLPVLFTNILIIKVVHPYLLYLHNENKKIDFHAL
jgi:hypothetical protein